MKIWLVVLILIGLAIGGIFFWPKKWADPRGLSRETENLALEKYDFDSLRTRGGVPGKITILGPIKAVEERRKAAKKVYSTKFETREISFESEGKKISGMINYFPERSSSSKVVIMVRGYADTAGYYTGFGSWGVADKLAEAGYTTISLDFLGFANSDAQSEDVMEARFEKVVSVLDLMASVKELPWVDKEKIGFWAHSNGGQITLSVLEALGGNYPTVLWAPMTNPFPQSLIDTNSSPGDDISGVQAELRAFEKHYDARRYAFENYYEWIHSPVLIQQGTADVWCKVEWQQKVVAGINDFGVKASLKVYEGDDHNLKYNWENAVAADLVFYSNNLRNGR